MMHREFKAILICSAALLSALPLSVGAATEESTAPDSVMSTGGMGFSYPLIASLSVGVIAPILKVKEGSQFGFPGVPAVHATVDLGLGGGMVSGGLSFPLNVGYGGSAVSVKAAALRTWLLDVGVKKNLTYTGGVVEFLVPSHPSGKLGLGYFHDNEPTQSPHSNFIYVYFGVGL